jgi:hypothetical protein
VPPSQAFLVRCDERINDGTEPHAVKILLQFAAVHAGEYHSFLITQSLQGSTVRVVTVNRLERDITTSPASSSGQLASWPAGQTG